MNKILYKLKSKASIEFLVILVLFMIGFLVRLYHLGDLSLCGNEVMTTIRIKRSFLETICLLRHSEFPPLHYILLHLWTFVFGISEWALRFPSAIFSSLTIIVIYKLGKEFFSKGAGLISAALLAFSPFAINFAQDAKMYGLFWFLAAVSFLFFYRFLKDQKKNSYIFYIITSILSCYTMYTGFLFLVIQSIVFLLIGEKTRWRKWFFGQLIIVIFCILWVIYFLCSEHLGFNSRLPGAAFDYFTFFLRAFVFIIGSDVPGLGGVNCFLYVFLIALFFINVLTIFYKNRKIGLSFPTNYYCLFMWIIISVFIYFIFDYFFFRIDLRERHIGFIQIPIILLVSSQINNLHGSIKRMMVLVMFVIALSSTYLYFKYDLGCPKSDWRSTVKELNQNLRANDIVLFFLSAPDIKYYFKVDTSGSYYKFDKTSLYYRVDTNKFFGVSEKVCSSEFLLKKGILTNNIHSIFILYLNNLVPEIKLNGFSLYSKVSHGEIVLLHFQRTLSKE